MADHRLGDRALVHDLVDRLHVEIVDGPAYLPERLLGTDVDDEGTRPHQVAGTDQLAEQDLVGNVGEHRPQALAVTPVRGRGDAVDADVRVALARPVYDPPVALGGGVMGLVDDHEIERRHGLEVGRAGKGRDHGEGGAPAPRLGAGIDDRRRERPG